MHHVEVVVTEEFAVWYADLTQQDADVVAVSVERLEQRGVTLGFPYTSAIKGTDEPLRELRVQSHGRPLRVFFAFDPLRQAVLLIGGDKTGNDRFYEVYIPKAEAIWREYLEDIRDEIERHRKARKEGPS